MKAAPGARYARYSSRLGAVALAITLPAGLGVADRGDASDRAIADWKIVYEHYDERIGEGGAGIDRVSSARRHPNSLVRRARGSDDNFHSPTWSPNGRDVAFSTSTSNGESLDVIGADGTRRRSVARAEVADFRWSPDGKRIAFVSECSFPGCKNGRIEVVRADGRDRRVFVQPPGLSRWASIELQDWSARDDILYLIRDRGKSRLYWLSGKGGRPRILADSREEGRLGGASWSSDGDLIAYKRRCMERVDIFCDLVVMTRDGHSKRRLRHWRTTRLSGPTDDAATWIPGSSRLVSTEWGFESHVRVLDAGTGGSTAISNTPWRNVTVGSDSRTIGAVVQLTGDPAFLLISRLDGSVLVRRKVPFDAGYAHGYDLWVS